MVTRTRIVVDGAGFLLAEEEDTVDVKRRIEAAVQSGGRFIDLAVAGSGEVSVLVSTSTRVVISRDSVDFDVGNGDEDVASYGSEYDML